MDCGRTPSKPGLKHGLIKPSSKGSPPNTGQPYPPSLDDEEDPGEGGSGPRGPSGNNPSEQNSSHKSKDKSKSHHHSHSHKKQKKGEVYGIVRRKGEKNPLKWGLQFEEGLLDHKALRYAHELPPRDKAEYKVWKKRVMGEHKERMERRKEREKDRRERVKEEKRGGGKGKGREVSEGSAEGSGKGEAGKMGLFGLKLFNIVVKKNEK